MGFGGTPARIRNEVTIDSAYELKIAYYNENASFKKVALIYWPFLIIFIVALPVFILNAEQATSLGYPNTFVIGFILSIFIFLANSLVTNWITLVIFDIQKQNLKKGRLYRTFPKREKFFENIPFSSIKSIELSQNEKELSPSAHSKKLALYITFTNSNSVFIVLHFPNSGKIQGLTSTDWQIIFQRVLKSTSSTTTSEITKDYVIESPRRAYMTDRSY